MVIIENLDKRIKDFSDVQTRLHYDDKFVGEKGYFADDLTDLKNLSNCNLETLEQIDLTMGDMIFRTPYAVDMDNYGCRFFIPESLLKPVEKKYRPFTGIEFAEKFDLKLGGIIRLKNIITQHHYKVVFTGYRWHGDDFEVFLNGDWINMLILLNTYEYDEEGKWKTFGVEVEE